MWALPGGQPRWGRPGRSEHPSCLCGSCCSTEAAFTLPSSSTGFQHQGSPLFRWFTILLTGRADRQPLLFPLSASGSWNHLTLSSEFHLSSRFVLPLLLNWTLVGLPSTQQSESTYTRVWWRKVSADCRAEQGEWSPYSQDPNFLMAFREGFLKMVFVLRAAEVMAFFGWLVSCEAIGWCFENLSHQSSGSMFVLTMYSLSSTCVGGS